MTDVKKRTKGISIVGIVIKDFQRLRAAELKFTKTGLKRVTGLNAAGKSALLRAIRTAFTGRAAGGEVPINTESENGTAEVELTLDNGYQIRRTWTDKGSYLTVVAPDGGKHGQTMVNEWLTPYGFDPLQFFTLRADKQREILLSLSKDPNLPRALERLDKRFEMTRAKRTPYESAKMKLTRLTPPKGERPEQLDVTATMKELTVQEKKQAKHDQCHRDMQMARDMLKSTEEHIKTLRSQLESAGEERTLAKKNIAPAEKALVANPDVSEKIAELRAALEKADEVNKRGRPWDEYDRKVKELKKAKKLAKDLTGELDDIVSERVALLEAAGIPIEGLSFEEGQPLLNGLPLDQASGMERIVFGMEVAMASDCKLKAVLVDEGNDLDVNALARAHEIAEVNGWQVFLCRIEPGGPGEEIAVSEGVAK